MGAQVWYTDRAALLHRLRDLAAFAIHAGDDDRAAALLSVARDVDAGRGAAVDTDALYRYMRELAAAYDSPGWRDGLDTAARVAHLLGWRPLGGMR